MAHTVSLSWAASADAVQGYNLYRATNAPGTEAPPPVNSALITGTTYTDTVPGPGAYEYVVTSMENGAESVHSNEVAALVLPFPPTDLVVTAIA